MIRFVRRVVPAAEEWERVGTARTIIRIQAGDAGAFADVYGCYFERVYSYLRIALADAHEAEDAAQDVFIQAMASLPEYEIGTTPFSSWLFRVARNRALNHFAKHGRTTAEEPSMIDRRRERTAAAADMSVLERLSDQELMIFIHRMPAAQRQVVALRYMFDLSTAEIGEVLGRSPEAVRMLLHRAHTFLRARLVALGREPRTGAPRKAMRPIPRKAWVLRGRRYALK